MSDRLGPVTLAQRSNGLLGQPDGDATGVGPWRPYSEDTARLIDTEVRRVLDDSSAEAFRLLRLRRTQLDALTHALLEHETLDEQEILNVTGLRPGPRSGTVPLPLPIAAYGANGNTNHQ